MVLIIHEYFVLSIIRLLFREIFFGGREGAGDPPPTNSEGSMCKVALSVSFKQSLKLTALPHAGEPFVFYPFVARKGTGTGADPREGDR